MTDDSAHRVAAGTFVDEVTLVDNVQLDTKSDSDTPSVTASSSDAGSAATPAPAPETTRIPVANPAPAPPRAPSYGGAWDSPYNSPPSNYPRPEWSPPPAPAGSREPVGAAAPAGSRSSYSSRSGFTATRAAATGAAAGAAAGLANSVSGAWQKRGSAKPSVKATRKQSKRQAMLTLSRVEPWSVMKFSFVSSLVAFTILFVAVALLYMVLSALGVFDSLQNTVNTMTSSEGSAGTNISHYFSASLVLGYTAMLGAFNVVLITALSTIGSVIYNLIAKTFGGVEVTLRETD